MDDEANRLRTFAQWPVDGPFQVAAIAHAGFFSTGQGLEVQCWRCGGRISEWNNWEENTLRVLHRRLDPQCPLVVQQVEMDGASPNRAYHCAPHREAPVIDNADENTNDTIYKIDVLRLISFTDWPVEFISRESLAAAGFYYLRSGAGQDRVRCAWCGGELMNWARGDSPLVEHLKHFPNCQYANAKHRAYHADPRSRAPVVRTMSTPMQVNESVLERGVEGVVLGVSGVAEVAMANMEARERSFDNHWPSHLQQQPKDLAAAGFYYVGPDDQVRCFQCGGGLKTWMRDDDPWMEHTKWFPSCSYLALASDRRVDTYMNQAPALQALACGLQEHCIRRAIVNRLRTDGAPFRNAESLIDAALHEQISQEESFHSPEAEASPDSPPPVIYIDHLVRQETKAAAGNAGADGGVEVVTQGQQEGASVGVGSSKDQMQAGAAQDLEEENRRLREARLCKVCMDTEVGIVFLPCGHLVSCVHCAPCLTSCPLCRAAVKGVVRTFLS